MDNIVIDTPAGYKVTLKPELTYGEFVEIQKILTASMKFDFAKNQVRDIDASVLNESNKKAMDFLIVEVVMPDGQKSNNKLGAIYDMPMADGQMIAEQVNNITNTAQVEPKKGGKLQTKPS